MNNAGKSCGKIRDSSGRFGLAMLRIPDVINKQPLTVANADTNVTVTTRIPSWWPSDNDVIIQQAVAKSG